MIYKFTTIYNLPDGERQMGKLYQLPFVPRVGDTISTAEEGLLRVLEVHICLTMESCVDPDVGQLGSIWVVVVRETHWKRVSV